MASYEYMCVLVGDFNFLILSSILSMELFIWPRVSPMGSIINDNHSLHLPTFQHGCFHIHPGLSIYFLICSTEDPGQHLKASDSTRAPLFALGRVWRNNYFMFTRLLRLFPTMDQCHTCLGTFRLFTNIPYQTVSKSSAWHGCEAIEGRFGLPSIQKWPWLNTDPFESQPCSRSVCGTTRQLSS